MPEYNVETLCERALRCMRTFIGQGETEGNNRGPFIHWELEGHKLSSPAPAWCALTCRKAYAIAYTSLGVSLPRWLFRSGSTPEPGALRLTAGMAREGRQFTAIGQVRPGDLGLMKRPDGHHVYMVEWIDPQGVVHTIEGNVGRYPAKVKRMTRDVQNDADFVAFVSLRKEQ